jgi:predicted enzyme related to lactoylglutathione lyase
VSSKLHITEVGRVVIPTTDPDRSLSVDSGIIISTDDIEADHASLKDAGVDVDPEIARWGPPVPPMFRLRDPSGNALSIVEPLQG